MLLYLLHPQFLKAPVSRIVKLRQSRTIGHISFRDTNHHPLPRTSKQHAVSIQLIRPPLGLVDVLPAVTPEIKMLPLQLPKELLVIRKSICNFANEGGGGIPPVPFEPSKNHRKVVFLFWDIIFHNVTLHYADDSLYFHWIFL